MQQRVAWSFLDLETALPEPIKSIQSLPIPFEYVYGFSLLFGDEEAISVGQIVDDVVMTTQKIRKRRRKAIAREIRASVHGQSTQTDKEEEDEEEEGDDDYNEEDDDDYEEEEEEEDDDDDTDDEENDDDDTDDEEQEEGGEESACGDGEELGEVDDARIEQLMQAEQDPVGVAPVQICDMVVKWSVEAEAFALAGGQEGLTGRKHSKVGIAAFVREQVKAETPRSKFFNLKGIIG
jgi:hypothetical protein